MDRAEHVCSARYFRRQLVPLWQGIIDLNAEVPDSAFDLCVPE